jgi:hypothetical protein
MVVSIIALIFALSGSAVAGVATISALSKKEKKQTRKIADKEINKLAPGLAVKSANTANSLTMYAQVTPAGGLTGNTSGVGGVTRPFTGTYCLSGLLTTPRGGAATVDYDASNNQYAQYGNGIGISTCPAGTGAHVAIYDSTGAPSNAGFFVTMWP